MKPSRIYLIRHGQSASNADKTVHAHTPDWKIPLTAIGKEQAHKAAKSITKALGKYRQKYGYRESIGIYVSPFLRARETWQAMDHEFLRQLNIVWVKEDPRLREQEWGHLRLAEHTDLIDAERQEYGPFFYRIPDGESGADVYDRCTGFLDTLYRDFEKPHSVPDNILIVTHGFTLRVLLMRWLHWTVEEFHQLKNPANCAVIELGLGRDGHYHLKQTEAKFWNQQPFPQK